MSNVTDLAIILLNYNGSADTIECIQSLLKSDTKYSFHIFVADNGSEKEDVNRLSEYLISTTAFRILSEDLFNGNAAPCNTFVRFSDNSGFAVGNNKVLKNVYDKYAYVLLLNNDTVVDSSFIEKMLNLMNGDDSIGFAGCRINSYYDRSSLWNCGGVLRPWGFRKYYSSQQLHNSSKKVIPAEFITGCALVIRKSVLEQYGLLCELFFHGEEDFNFCWRMKKNGVKGSCLTEPLVFHKVNATSGKTGVICGKAVSYYAYRIADMRQFYSARFWRIWKFLLLVVLQVHWSICGYSKNDVRKMISVLKRAAGLAVFNRADTLKIWDLTY